MYQPALMPGCWTWNKKHTNAGTQLPCYSWMESSHCKAVSMLCSLGMTLPFPSSGNVCSFCKPNRDASIHSKQPLQKAQVDNADSWCRMFWSPSCCQKSRKCFFPPFWPQIDGTLSAITSFCCSFLAVITPGLQSMDGQYLPMDRMGSCSISVRVCSSVRPLGISY